jgi:uncharacterized protein YndB with AHSA1/START domain
MKNATSVTRVADRELVIVHTFNGPSSILFDAWTKPELLKRWWAPKSRGVSLFECESDLRVGGLYRYVFGRDRSNPEVFSGRYIEIDAPARLVLSQVYERLRDAAEAVVTVTFEERGDTTLITVHQLYPNRASLDGALASGMESGMRETFEQLEVLVTS